MGTFTTKFHSAKSDWETPQNLFDVLNQRFRFTCDVAASSSNTKVKDNYFTEEQDAIQQAWKETCWCNPPYTTSLKLWAAYGLLQSHKYGSTIVMLLPCRTNTEWWHKFCMQAEEIIFLRGRPKFGDAKHGLPQPLALVVFRDHTEPIKVSSLDIRNL